MLAQQLKKLREIRNITQKNFADMIGVAASTIGGWETGDRHPDHEMLIKIADLFDVSVDSLLGRSNLDVKVDYDLEREKFKSEIDKLKDDVINSMDQALATGVLTEDQAKISLQVCKQTMILLIQSNISKQ